MAKIFAEDLPYEKNKVEASLLQHLYNSAIEKITLEQIDSIVGLLNSIKNSVLVKSWSHKWLVLIS